MEIKKNLLKSKHAIGLAMRFLLAIVLIAVILVNFNKLQNLDVRALIEGIGTLWMRLLAVLGVYLVKGLTLVVPASLVYIAVGMALKPVTAVLINCAGIVVEVTVTYFLGLILGGNFVLNKLDKTKYGKKVRTIYEKNQKSGIFIIRILGLPIDFCSLFFGAMRAKFLPYLLMSLAGILPRVIVLTILGDKVYDLIPMKYIVPAVFAFVIIFMAVSIIKYLIKSNKSEESFGKPAYTPICEEKKSVIFDTDMGPDCDDAGALALLIKYAEKYDINILGVANCTSNEYGNGAIRAICSYYGKNDVIVGQHSGREILPNGLKYNKILTEKYCDPETGLDSLDSVDFYKSLLEKAENDSVTVITTGTFTNIASILNEEPELFNKKVHAIVAMAGKFPSGKEFNIECDPISAATVLEKFNNQIVFSAYETGEDILTGFEEERENNPVFDAYYYYKDKKIPCLRHSWDLTAVQYAIEGNGEFYSLSKPTDVKISANGEMKTEKNKYSRRYFIIQKAENEIIAEYLNNIIRN